MKLDIGKLLVSEPFMEDLHFKRSVVLLCDYSTDEGAVGFVLNKSINMKIHELIGDFPEFDLEVNYGGPVGTDTIHYLHDKGDILEGSTKIVSGLYWGGDFEKLKFLIKSELILPKNIRFYVGYSGWSPGQLEDEMNLGSWVVNQAYSNFIFKSKQDELWKEVLDKKGDTFTVISTMKDSMFLN